MYPFLFDHFRAFQDPFHIFFDNGGCIKTHGW